MKIISSFALIILLFSATTFCSKVAIKPAIQRLQNRWSYISLVTTDYNSGTALTTVVNADNGDYWDFRASGMAYSRFKSVSDSSTWFLSGDSTIVFGNGTSATIEVLTDAQLKLYIKKAVTPTLYKELIYDLAR